MTVTKISAEVVAMSRNFETGTILTTFRVKCPKFILAEIGTHRVLSKSFSSSRAIPAKVMRRNVLQDPVVPVSFGKNQAGMQSKQELSGFSLWLAKQTWLLARYPACLFHWLGEKIGLHKQICNRIVEPWMWAEGVISGTDWGNFYNLRCHADAQPEFRDLAMSMRAAQYETEPRVYRHGLVHLPFILDSEWADLPIDTLKRISAARCARVSYYLKDGKLSDVESDLKLCDRLFGANPKHLCYDSETEVLTSEGWSNWSNVRLDTRLAAINIDTKEINFENPSKIINEPYRGLMYYVKRQGVDLKVTPNHNMVVCSRLHDQSFSNYRFQSAENVKGKPVRYLKSGILKQTQKPSDVLGLDPYHFMRLIGLFVGDGYVHNGHSIYFHLKKSRKVQYLQKLAFQLGIKLESKSGGVFKLVYPGIGNYFRDNCYYKGVKRLPDWYLTLPNVLVEGLLCGLKNSDGSIKRNTWVYSTTSMILVDQLTSLAAVNGFVFSPSFTTHDNPKWNTSCRLTFSTRVAPRIEPSQRGRGDCVVEGWVSYDGFVHCATVSTGALIVRRNNVVTVSGNSPSEHVATAAEPGRYGNFKDWKQFRQEIE